MPYINSGGSGGSGGHGGEIGYDQITSGVGIASITEAAGTTVISCAAHIFDGSPVLATFFTPQLQTPSTAGANATVCLFEGATQIGRLCSAANSASAVFWVPATGMLRFTPTAASHTYTVTVFASIAAGQVYAGAGGTGAQNPCFIRFTHV